MNSRFCAPAHAASRSCDARVTPPSSSTATFASLLTIATEDDFDFPPPPSVPPTTVWCRQRDNDDAPSASAATGTTLSPDELPSPPRLNVAPTPLRHYHKHSASASTTMTALSTDGINDSVRSRYFASGPINFGRSQIFDEMDERVSRSQRAQYLGRQKQQQKESQHQFDENSQRDAYDATRQAQYATRNLDALDNSRHTYDSLNNTLNNPLSVVAFHNSRQTRDGSDSAPAQPYSGTAIQRHDADSKAFCLESEDSALPDSSVSMSPTNSSASTSSAGGAASSRYNWSKNERDKENLSQSARYLPRGCFSNLGQSPVVTRVGGNASDADSGVRSSFADSDDAGSGASRPCVITAGDISLTKSQFGYGRWVRAQNGKWQRVGDFKKSGELTRARSADRFASVSADNFKTEGIFKKHTRQYNALLESSPRLLQRANTDDVWLRASKRDTSADVWQRNDKLSTTNIARNVNQLVKQFSNATDSEINEQKAKVEQIHHKSNVVNSQQYVSGRTFASTLANVRPMVTGINVQPTMTSFKSGVKEQDHDRNENIQLGVLAGIATTGAVISTVRTTIIEKADVLPEGLHEHVYDVVAEPKFLPSHNNKEEHEQSLDHNNNNSNVDTNNNNNSFKNFCAEDRNVWQKAEAVSEIAHILSSDKEDRAPPSPPLHRSRTDTSFKNNDNVNNGNKQDASFEQLAIIRDWLGAKDFKRYNIFGVSLKRSAGVEDGSVGLILTSALADPARLHAGDEYITIQRVITGSIADYDERLAKGDRVFYIQNRLTQHMSAAEARKILKSPAATVTLIVGRLINPNLSAVYSRTATVLDTITSNSMQTASFNGDPALECYDTETTTITLYKTELGVGLALDGGRGCKYGDRPIIVRKVFAVGSAAKDGKIQAGDEICAIDGCSLVGKTQLEAWKILKARPEGMVFLEIRKRIAPLR